MPNKPFKSKKIIFHERNPFLHFLFILDNIRENFFAIEMNNSYFNLNYLSPTGLIGFWVLFIGLIFTGVMFYFVFFRLNEEDYSCKDRNRKILEKEIQKQRIAKLYPKGKY